MPPRGFTNPTPKTESAREAVKSFYCELCTKGYARMNEYEAHLSSYDHAHKQRLKDMRQLTRDPAASSKARKAEARADKASGGIISIKLGGEEGSGFKKGGFKKAGFKSAFGGSDLPEKKDGANGETAEAGDKSLNRKANALEANGDGDSDTDVDYEMYDPRHPTA